MQAASWETAVCGEHARENSIFFTHLHPGHHDTPTTPYPRKHPTDRSPQSVSGGPGRSYLLATRSRAVAPRAPHTTHRGGFGWWAWVVGVVGGRRERRRSRGTRTPPTTMCPMLPLQTPPPLPSTSRPPAAPLLPLFPDLPHRHPTELPKTGCHNRDAHLHTIPDAAGRRRSGCAVNPA